MKDTEEILRKAPLAAPSEGLDCGMEAQFNEARQSAAAGWMNVSIPVWAAAPACVLCLLAGMWFAPQRPEKPVQADAHDAQPEVLVRVARNSSSASPSPFVRDKARRENRFSSEWTIVN